MIVRHLVALPLFAMPPSLSPGRAMSGHAGDAGPGQVAPIGYQYNDGGRAAAGYKGTTGDCVCRAIAIATARPYQEIYELINDFAKRERKGKRKRGRSSARTGVHKGTIRRVIESFGWVFVPTMGIGTGCRVHLRADELPRGRLIVNLSRHMSAVIDGVVHDIHDPCRDGTRCVYGYWFKVDDTTPAQLDLFDTCGVR